MSDLLARRKARRYKKLRRPPGRGSLAGVILTEPMVDRLFWRGGFGPTDAIRAQWIGKPAEDAVEWLLTASSDPLNGPAPAVDGVPLDPIGDESDRDSSLAWLDRMIRSSNPMVERLTLFWHRHFANSKAEVSPPQLMHAQIALFRKYSSFGGGNAGLTFKQLANDVTADGSMLRYLTGEYNVKGRPNENYARELMELFALGVTDDAGQKIYREGPDGEVQQLAKALSGFTVDDTDPANVKIAFDPNRWYNGPKKAFGQEGNWKSQDVIDLVLAHPAHPNFFIRKLWGEFNSTPPPAADLAALVAAYRKENTALKPLLRRILLHPSMYERLDEPDMIKPPVVFVVGILRALGLYIEDARPYFALNDMGQVPYFPPNVAGWEGGDAWINTNTALFRFSFAGDLMRDGGKAVPDAGANGETGQQALDRAFLACGKPWISPAGRAYLLELANRLPNATTQNRVARQRILRALLIAGPDAQVM